MTALLAAQQSHARANLLREGRRFMDDLLASPHPRILGIDPGLNITGYAVLAASRPSPRLVEAGVIRIASRRAIELRIADVFDGVEETIAAFRPAAMAIEEVYSHYQRPRTAILMGHARGAICLAAARAEIPVYHYAATQIKRVLTGNGRAPKQQMQLAVCRELGLDEPPDPPDVADALAIALCHHYLQKGQETRAQSPEPRV